MSLVPIVPLERRKAVAENTFVVRPQARFPVAAVREMLRALHRCAGPSGTFFHALDLACDAPDPKAPKPLGYVR